MFFFPFIQYELAILMDARLTIKSVKKVIWLRGLEKKTPAYVLYLKITKFTEN